MTTSKPAGGKVQLRVMKGCDNGAANEDYMGTRSDLLFYRGQTMAIVRHFFEMSCQIGRLPSILGREFFRARVSHHAIPSFEDQVVFVHDVERALARLTPQDTEVISMVGLYHYSLDEVAKLTGRCRTTVVERFSDAVDRLAEIFLTSGLLKVDQPDRHVRQFSSEQPLRGTRSLPPKKPAASVGAGEYHEVTRPMGKYSFIAGQRVV